MSSDVNTPPLTEILRPGDEAAVAQAIQKAAQDGTPVYPMGGGTRLDYGVCPSQPGQGLSLVGLNRILDYPARDLTITAEAGVTVAALAKRLAAEGQRLPIDVPYPERATLGGAIAAGLAGPRQYRWGTVRDYVIGLRAVDGCGNTFSAGGRVVKNAAGYDLCRLLTGSLGTLGVIVQVTLMVKPMPETSALVACALPDWTTAERLLAGLVQTKTLPAAIEVLSGPAWKNDPALGLLAESSVGWLVVGLEGTLAEVDWAIGQLHEEWRQAGAASPITLRGNRADPLWERLTEFSAPQENWSCATACPGAALDPTLLADHGTVSRFGQAVSLGGAGLDNESSQAVAHPSSASRIAQGHLVLQAHVLPGNTVATAQRLLAIDANASILAHAGNGVILARLSLEPDEAATALDQRLRLEVAAAGGSTVVLRQPPGAALSRETVWGPAKDSLAVMQAIKDQFDPRGILNRGRFIFAS